MSISDNSSSNTRPTNSGIGATSTGLQSVDDDVYVEPPFPIRPSYWAPPAQRQYR